MLWKVLDKVQSSINIVVINIKECLMSDINAERLAKIYTKIRAKRLELEKEVSALQE